MFQSAPVQIDDPTLVTYFGIITATVERRQDSSSSSVISTSSIDSPTSSQPTSSTNAPPSSSPPPPSTSSTPLTSSASVCCVISSISSTSTYVDSGPTTTSVSSGTSQAFTSSSLSSSISSTLTPPPSSTETSSSSSSFSSTAPSSSTSCPCSPTLSTTTTTTSHTSVNDIFPISTSHMTSSIVTDPSPPISISISVSHSITTVVPPPLSSSSGTPPPPPPLSSTSGTMSSTSPSQGVGSGSSSSPTGSDPGSPDGISTSTAAPPPPTSTIKSTSESSVAPPPPSSASTPPPPPTSSISTDTGQVDQITTSAPPVSSNPPPPTSSSPGGGGTSSTPSSSQSGGAVPPPSSPSSTTTNRLVYTVSNGNVQTYSVIPSTTVSSAVSFTTTDAHGSMLVTIPPEFTTIFVTTDSGGQYTSMTEVVANPPGVLNPSGDERATGNAFFQNKGAVAGVFIAAALAITAIVVFILFGIRRRRKRLREQRESGIAAALADSRNQRLADESGGIMRPVPSGLRNRSPWPDDDDEDETDMYASGLGPILHSNFNGVGPPVQTMTMTQARPFPVTPTVYAPARTHSRSPSPKADSALLPPSPTLHSGLPYLTRQTGSNSPDPTNSASALHTSSGGHTSYRTPGSAGKSGEGSGETMTPQNPPPAEDASSALDTMYPPAYTQFANTSETPSPRIGVAFEPDPVEHNRQITGGLSDPFEEPLPRPSEDTVASSTHGGLPIARHGSLASRSLYSQEESEEWNAQDITPREDHRIDPLMRIRGGLVSAASVGPRDDEDYMRRVIQPPLNSPSSGSHSHSQSQSHSHSHSTH